MMICLPAGRAAGEVMRASLLAKHLGAARAASASTRLQVAYVFAIGVLSAIEAATVASRFGVRSPLALFLAGSAGLDDGVLRGLVRRPAGRALPSLGREPSPARHALRSAVAAHRARNAPNRSPPGPPHLLRQPGTRAQAVQYGVILAAVGGVASIRGALLAHGIEIVGSTLGEFLPNQIGVVDTTYRTFALDVGFAAAPARALSIALLARLARLLVAAACIAIAALARRAVVAQGRSGEESGGERPAGSPDTDRVPDRLKRADWAAGRGRTAHGSLGGSVGSAYARPFMIRTSGPGLSTRAFVEWTLRHGKLLWVVALLLAVPSFRPHAGLASTATSRATSKSSCRETRPPVRSPRRDAISALPGLQYLGVVVDTQTTENLPAGERFLDDLAHAPHPRLSRAR